MVSPRFYFFCAFAAAVLINIYPIGVMASTALDPTASGRSSETMIVMFEQKSCNYCRLFNRDVQPFFARSRMARQAPLHRVDVSDKRLSDYVLDKQITSLPTFVLIRDGKEVGRIAGYPGRKNFFMLMRLMLKNSQ